MKIKSHFPGQRFCRFTDLPKGRVLGESSASDRLPERCEKKCCKLTEISDDTRFNFFLIFQTNLCVLPKFLFSDTGFECNTGRLDVATFDFSPTFKWPPLFFFFCFFGFERASNCCRLRRVVDSTVWLPANEVGWFSTSLQSINFSFFFFFFSVRKVWRSSTDTRNQGMEMNNSTRMSTFARSLIQQCRDFMNLLILKAIIITSLRC